MPITPPFDYTDNINLGLWVDYANPGAAALNNNWTLIDAAIWNVSQSIFTGYSSDAPILISSNNISLLYDAVNLKVSESKLTTIQNIATTSSPTFAGLTVNGNGNFTGNLIVGGKLTAEEFYTEYNSSSVIFSSGSTKFGDTSNDTHQFTGSILLSGNLTSSGNAYFGATQFLKLIDTSGGNGYLEFNNVGTIDADTFYFRNKAHSLTTMYLNNTTNRVGIGTTTPAFKLDVSGSINIPYGPSVGYSVNTNRIISQTSAGIEMGVLDYKGTYLHTLYSNDNKFSVVTGSSTKFMVSSSGNVGIGTTSPSQKLDLSVGNVDGIKITSTNAPVIRLYTTANQADARNWQISTNYAAYGDFHIQRSRTSGSVPTTTYVISANKDGNVGIGVSNPTEKLIVLGNISASGNLLLNGQVSSSGAGNNYLIGNTSFGLAKAPTEKISIYGNINQSGSYSIYNNFSSGWAGSGWRLDQNISNTGSSKLELDDLTVRGTMNVYELLINQIRATNGSMFVSSVAKVASVTQSGGFGGYDDKDYYIHFEDPDSFGYCPFLVNDLILCQRTQLSGSVLIKRVVKKVTGVNGMMITASKLTDAPTSTGVIEKGDTFVRFGNSTNTSRQGTIYLTSDDSNAPFQDTINGVASWADWTNKTKLKVRLGSLSGLTSDNFGTLSDYGMYAKGGIYLESSGSPDSIALKVDSGSAQLTMKKSNNTIFDFNTQTATAKIAGWSFDNDKIWANSMPLYYFFEQHGSGSYPYIHIAHGLGIGNEDVGVLLGRIPPSLGMNAGQIGLIGYDNYISKKYFVLTDATQSIAGWNFDNQKLYTGTDIVLDGTNKKVSVYADRVKMYYTNTSNYGISGSGFQLGSTNNIAGWSFTNTELSSPKITLGAYDSRVTLDATTNNIGLHIITDIGAVDIPRYLSVGTITDNTGAPSNDTGICYVRTGDTPYFKLSDGGNSIASWNFTQTQLYILSASVYAIDLNSTNKSVGVNDNKVKMYHTNNNAYGISGSGFHLGSTNNIAGWSFDSTKLYNGNVKLSVSASENGMVISSQSLDIVKIGDFNYTTSSLEYTASNITDVFFGAGITSITSSDVSNNAPDYNDVDKWYEPSGSRWYLYDDTPMGAPTLYSSNTPTPSFTVGGIFEASSWTHWVAHRLDNINLVMGNTLKLEYVLKIGDLLYNHADTGGNAKVFIRYHNTNGDILYNHVIHEETVPDVGDGKTLTYNKTGSASIDENFPYYSNVSYITINYTFSGGSQLSNVYPYDMNVSYFKISGYNNYLTRISNDGFEVSNSPSKYIRFNKYGTEISANNFKVGGINVTRNHGRLSTFPEQNVQIGDIFILSSSNVPYTAVNINSTTGEIYWASRSNTTTSTSNMWIDITTYGAVGNNSTDNTTAIQNAIDAAGGKPVYIPSGTFITGQLTLRTNSYIIGNGTGSLLKLKAGVANNTHVLYASASNNITLDNFKIDGNYSAQTAGYNTTDVQFIGVQNLVIKNMHIVGGEAEGIYLNECHYAQIVNNNFSYNNAATVDASGLHLDASNYCLVSNNISTYNGFHGIILTGAEHNLVSNNICNYNGYEGIRIQISSINNTINANTCLGNDRTGIYCINSSSNNLITNNDCSDGGWNAFAFYSSPNNTIYGNKGTNNWGYGIEGVATEDINQLVGFNDFRSNASGMYIEGSSDNKIRFALDGHMAYTGSFNISGSLVLSNSGNTIQTKINSGSILIENKNVPKYHGHQSSSFVPTGSNFKNGDTYSSGSKNKIFMYANSGWRLLN